MNPSSFKKNEKVEHLNSFKTDREHCVASFSSLSIRINCCLWLDFFLDRLDPNQWVEPVDEEDEVVAAEAAASAVAEGATEVVVASVAVVVSVLVAAAASVVAEVATEAAVVVSAAVEDSAAEAAASAVVEAEATEMKTEKLLLFFRVICHFLCGNENNHCCFLSWFFTHNIQHETKKIYRN